MGKEQKSKKHQIRNLEITAGVASYSNQEGEGQSEGRMCRKPSK